MNPRERVSRGTKNSLMVSPALGRRLFNPCYHKTFELVYQTKAHVFLHSDGPGVDRID